MKNGGKVCESVCKICPLIRLIQCNSRNIGDLYLILRSVPSALNLITDKSELVFRTSRSEIYRLEKYSPQLR